MESINIFYDINNNILNNYNIENKNYEFFQNINEINSNNIIYEKLKNINNNSDINNKITDIMDLYKNINDTNKLKKDISKKIINEQINNDEITIIYNTNNQDEIQIFGKDFVSINEGKIKILIDGKIENTRKFITLNSEQKKQKLFELKLLGIKNVTNMGGMFSGCSSLKSLPDISKWDTKNVTNMTSVFNGCSSLNNIPDISEWDTKNVTYMNDMFLNCY